MNLEMAWEGNYKHSQRVNNNKKLKWERRPAGRADTKRAGQGTIRTKSNQARGNVTVSVSEADASKITSARPLLRVEQNNLCYDLGEPILTTSSVHELYRLQLTESLQLKDTDWHFVSVNPEQKGTWHRIRWFELQEKKIQKMPPWKYLGLEIGNRTIVPQKLEINPRIKTLADVHKLCGSLNWIPLFACSLKTP
ncbi:uncharacterized protein GJ701_017022 [Geothlypis trichas]